MVVASTYDIGPYGKEMVRWRAGYVHDSVARLKAYQTVDKNPHTHVDWRIGVRQRAAKHNPMQRALWQACKHDPLFFINTFCWIVEPRGEDGLIPFLTWCHQDPVIMAIYEAMGIRDVVGDKSRAQGASWIVVVLYVHQLIFWPNRYLAMVSKDEETADDQENPDSLGWKIDFVLSKLPDWMLPNIERRLSTHTWQNKDNGSFLKCYAATQDVARGGRRWSFFLDEAGFFPKGKDEEAIANLQQVTNNRIVLSTPSGMDGAFSRLIHEKSNWLQVALYWWDNPVQRVGMYNTKDGEVNILEGDKIPGYEYRLDDRRRSPWFDIQDDRSGGNLMLLDRELNCDYGGSRGRPFSKKMLARARAKCEEELHRGSLLFDEADPTALDLMHWEEGSGYHFKLWRPLVQGRPAPGRYVVGCDIAAGTAGDHSSNSSLVVFDVATREQVGEFISNAIPPEVFARFALAVCHWFGAESMPYFVWEKNGPPGTVFTSEVLRIGYPNMFFMHDEERMGGKKTDRPGYHASRVDKTLSPLITMMASGIITVRSAEMIEECGQYIYDDVGKMSHPGSRLSRDASARGLSHGDRVIACAMAVRGLKERPNARKPANDRHKLAGSPSESLARRLWNKVQKDEKRKNTFSCKWR